MAEQQSQSQEENVNKGAAPESSDRGCGLFNFMGKKEENKSNDDTVVVDVVDTTTPYPNVEPPKEKKEEEEKHSLMDKLHRTHSNSSSVSYLINCSLLT